MPGINDRDIQAQAGLTPGSYTAANITVNAAGFVTAASNGNALLKRRVMITMYPASTTADTAANTTQVARLPNGSAGVSSQWKLMSAVLRTEVPNANPTTAQLYYSSNPGNAAFGAGTAALSAASASPAGTATALSAAGATVYQVSTSSFTGTLASTGIPSGSLLAPAFTALGGTKVSLEVELEEV